MTNPTPPRTTQTDTLLFEHFATLATAPDGIARLRELILQLAVQGKLGTQDAGDEPASVLLEKIRKDRAHLENGGKIKKGNIFTQVRNDEVPFKLPHKWSWIRVGFALNLVNGRAFKPQDWTSKGLPIVRIQNLNNLKAPFNYFDQDVDKKFHVYDDDLLIGWSGTPGTSFGAFIWERGHAILNQHIFRVEIFGASFFKQFLRLGINARLSEMIRQSHGGVGLQHITKGNMENIPIPLPPLAEQHRIVAKVDRLMALCDELEARQQQERAGCLKLGTASLAGLQNAESPEEFGRQWAQVCDAFDLILDCPENVAVLRQTILQLAVQGKLGTQEPGDEPAGKLVERIRSNKLKLIKEGIIKKEKVIEPVKETEGFFSLPSGWSWIKLYDLITFGPRNGYSPMPAINTTSTKVLTLSATTRGVFDNRYYKYLNEKIDENSHLWLNEGDILIQRSNTPGYVGISAIYHGDSNLFIYPDMMMKFRLSEEVNSDFIHKVINCGYSRNYFTSKAIGTSGSMKKINQNIVENLIIPLPPLTEQNRIVAKVDALMALCDALESRLKERSGVQGRLAGAIVNTVTSSVR